MQDFPAGMTLGKVDKLLVPLLLGLMVPRLLDSFLIEIGDKIVAYPSITFIYPSTHTLSCISLSLFPTKLHFGQEEIKVKSYCASSYIKKL